MGVRRAMEMVLTEANKNEGPIYTYGPLIHNNQVMALLESKGVKSIDDIERIKGGTIAIRAHGIPPTKRRLLKRSGLRIIDATCPKVAWVQAIIRYQTKKGNTAIIVGDRDHPEVVGLLGYAGDRAYVINQLDDVSHIPHGEKVFIVAQTTQDTRKYQEIVKAVTDRFPDALIFNTICDATINRQAEVMAFVGQVDAVVVVGGYHSGNTRRLAQISEAAGLPTFYVETEKDLDKERLSSMEVIGVTAGASTPNWMIKNIVNEIETIQSRKESFLGRWFKGAFKFMLLSNLLVALGGLALAYAVSVLCARVPDPVYPSLAFFYLYAMHGFNRFLDKDASTYNDPERASFYHKYRGFLIISATVSMMASLALGYYKSNMTFFAILGLSILGIIYSIRILPTRPKRLWRYTKIKEIPGSKTLSVALAWSVVITLLPLLASPHTDWLAATTSFILVFSMVYVRSALFDIFQAQGDLIVGVETLPIVLGEKKTLFLLKGVILSGVLISAMAGIFGLVGPFIYLLLLCLLSLGLSLLAYERRWLYPGTRLEALVEGNFFYAGLLGLIWQILS
jgi:(E)-4-hydroxy-3-methyl-but-2-enyl pyrophosphate reductase